MKMLLLFAILMISTSAFSMTYSQSRSEALYLSDKMAHELNLTAAQYNTVYEINLNYFRSIGSRRNVFGSSWRSRNLALQRLLSSSQYRRYTTSLYFYRPVYWTGSRWHWRIYDRYGRGQYFRPRPTAYLRPQGKPSGNRKGVNKPTTGKGKASSNRPVNQRPG